MVICWTDISHWIMVGQFVSIFCLFHNACVCPCHFLRRYGSSLGVLIAESLYTSTEHMQKTLFPYGIKRFKANVPSTTQMYLLLQNATQLQFLAKLLLQMMQIVLYFFLISISLIVWHSLYNLRAKEN